MNQRNTDRSEFACAIPIHQLSANAALAIHWIGPNAYLLKIKADPKHAIPMTKDIHLKFDLVGSLSLEPKPPSDEMDSPIVFLLPGFSRLRSNLFGQPAIKPKSCPNYKRKDRCDKCIGRKLQTRTIR